MKVNRVAKDITGTKIRGLSGGAIGILSRNETDLTSTGALIRPDRFNGFDFVHTRLFARFLSIFLEMIYISKRKFFIESIVFIG